MFERKLANIFLLFSFNICFGFSKEPSRNVLGSQKNRLFETVLSSTNNICFGWEIRKLYFCYTLLTKVMSYVLFLH